MTQTITLSANQVSQIISVAPGTRITSSGNGSISWVAGALADAQNGSGTWVEWAKGSSAGYMDAVRQMCIRATATGNMTVTLDEGRADEYPENIYFDTEMASYQTYASGNVTGLVGPDGDFVTWRLQYPQKTVTTMIVGGHSMAENHSAAGIYPLFDRGYSGRGAGAWACHLSKGALALIRNAGVAGESTTAYLARQQADILSQPGDCVLNMIGTNDFGTATPVDFATTKSNLEAIWRGQLNAGKIPIQCTVTAVDVGAFTSYEARQHEIPKLNEWIFAFARANPWLIVADTYGATIDPSSTAYKMLGVATDDGLHKSTAGGYLEGIAVWNALKPMLMARTGRVSSNADSRLVYAGSNQMIPNPMLLGTAGVATPGAGTITGTVPDQWTVNNIAGAPEVTLSKVASPSGVGDGLRMQIKSAASSQVIVYPTNQFSDSVLAGEFYYAECDLDVSAMSGITELNWRQRRVIGGVTYDVASCGADSTTFPATALESMSMRTPTVQIQAGSATNINGQLFIAIAAGGSCDLIFSRPEMRKVV